MKVLLTGSTSFLGTKFIELYGAHHQILGLASHDALNPVDLLDFEAVKKLYSGFQPDVVIHAAADLGRDETAKTDITETNPSITKNLVSLAQTNKTPFIFTSTEAVYGGKEQTGEYIETDLCQPRSPYGESKVKSEKIIMSSGLPYLITRGHRYVGISKTFNKPKQFPDTLQALIEGKQVHLDSQKLFKPVLINHLCEIIAYHINNNPTGQQLVNVGVNYATTYFDLVLDVAAKLGLDSSLIKRDGEETGWPLNSTLSLEKLEHSSYPVISYQQLLETLRSDYS